MDNFLLKKLLTEYDSKRIQAINEADIKKQQIYNSIPELQKIENFYGVTLYRNNRNIILMPKYDIGVQYNLDNWGKRLLKLQVAANILDDKVFAKMLGISTKRLDDLVRKNKYPTGNEILAIKTNFSDTNIDWLLFGD